MYKTCIIYDWYGAEYFNKSTQIKLILKIPYPTKNIILQIITSSLQVPIKILWRKYVKNVQ